MRRRRSVALIAGLLAALLLAACEADPDASAPDDDPSEAPDSGTDDGTDDGGDEPADDSGDEPTSNPLDDLLGDRDLPPGPGTDAPPLGEAILSEAPGAARVYFLAGGGETDDRPGPFIVSVHRALGTEQVTPTKALEELIEGPTGDDESLIEDVTSEIPDGVELREVSVEEGLATVELSGEFESGGGSFSMLARLAQVVFTLTQFEEVDEVLFTRDGEPLTEFSGEGILLDGPVNRADYLDLLPNVFVDTPAAGAEIDGVLHLTGIADAFEATVMYRLTERGGSTLREGFIQTGSSESWGNFDTERELEVTERTEATLWVFTSHEDDSSTIGIRTTPITLLP